jgi:hypothetical protein
VGEKAVKAKGAVDENVMVKLLSQYSERLIEMLDERFKVSTISSREGSSPPEDSATVSGAENATPEDQTDRMESATITSNGSASK